jgi:hypothetical protein
MPVDLLHYNPDTHRIRAQRSINPALERDLETDPFGESGQNYLHQLLMGDPTDPSKTDQSFTALKDDLREHGQSEPGIITRDRRRTWDMQPVAKAEEDRQPLIDRDHLFPRKFPEHAPDPPLVD